MATCDSVWDLCGCGWCFWTTLTLMIVVCVFDWLKNIYFGQPHTWVASMNKSTQCFQGILTIPTVFQQQIDKIRFTTITWAAHYT